MKADSMPFSKIISMDGGAREHYHVPKYQREYTWGLKEWRQLMQDIEENDPGYFLGSIICVNDSSDTVPGDELVYTLVDGQQRLATLSLLMMAIYQKLIGLQKEGLTFDDVEDSKTFQKTLDSLSGKLIKKKKEFRIGEFGGFEEAGRMCFCRFQPSTQNNNLADYLYTLSKIDLIKERPKPGYCGVRAIYKAYRYFQDKTPADWEELQKLVEKITQLIFVLITVGSQADAFTLFETLNNRGVPLSAVDIIKNKMLSEMDKKHITNIDEAFDQWQEIIAALPETSDQERFFRHFYNAFKTDDKIKVAGISRAVRSKIINIYEELIKKDPVYIFQQLREKAKWYGYFVNHDAVENKDFAAEFTDLLHIGTAPAYQILLYLISQHPNKVPIEEIHKIINLLGKYYVRRNITDIPGTRDLDLSHIEVIEKCGAFINTGTPLKFEVFSDFLLINNRAKPATLHQLRDKLNGGIYDENADITRYLLIMLNTTLQSKEEYKPDLWARDEKGRFVWTVEHVFPRTENITHEWIEMIGDGDKQKAEEIQERCVHCLGNLTLSGYNSNLATASFSKKQELAKDRTFLGHKINIGYKNGLALNNLEFEIHGKEMNLANAPAWKEEAIVARTKVMADLLIELYKFPGE